MIFTKIMAWYLLVFFVLTSSFLVSKLLKNHFIDFDFYFSNESSTISSTIYLLTSDINFMEIKFCKMILFLTMIQNLYLNLYFQLMIFILIVSIFYSFCFFFEVFYLYIARNFINVIWHFQYWGSLLNHSTPSSIK